ncbi:uncharacterized protein LY89DRAFT_73041 [Mollisia scopiformis]|uniref:Rhodopsin domain-containing protein n=1 Tax=Mollisia scopiformis TaxID=149040 RepID=A0A194XAJ7_MOLSC|nr:uncharacterized protein LY89DRAFT_73041 [Mollisia scopiformis]KUJ17169.1 hypothetical protein LY89DRAFT_73041 [Mollisia scopiformis]
MTVPVAGRGPQVQGVAGLFLALSTIAIGLRCYTRTFIVKSFGLDDWSALIAWVFFVFFCTFAISGVHYGTGQHAVDLPPADIPVGLKWWWACEPVYVLSNMCLKFSIGVMLLRITVARTHKIIIWTVVVVLEVYGAFYFFLFVLQCRPSAYFWTRYTGGKGTCIDPTITVDATYVYSAVSCWADWTLAIIPVFIVWNLQMNIRTKVGLSFILAMAAVASVATIIRIPYVKDLANAADFLYATTDVAIWSTAETGIGIAACSFATIRPLFRNFFLRSRLLGGSSSRGNSKSNPWPSSGRPGYIRSESRGGQESFGLRTDIGKNQGVTTVIASDADVEKGEEKLPIQGSSRKQSFGHSRGNGWNNSESKLHDSSDEEQNWGFGIRKTTVQTQVAD